jgi:MraZ protein
VFRGQFRHTIDPKGRVSVPAKFREALNALSQDGLIIVPRSAAVEVHSVEKWLDLESRIQKLSRFDPDARELKYVYLSQAQDVALDPQGRIQIPVEHRQMAGLDADRNVVIVGMLDHFEIWSAQRFASRPAGAQLPEDDLYRRLAEKGV